MTTVEPMTCGARNRHGEPCGLPPGWGTPSNYGRCRFHGGASPNGKVHAARLEALAEVRSLADLPVIDPAQALDAALSLAHSRLDALVRLGGDAAVEGQALDRLLRAARAASDVDIAQRHQALIERTARSIATAFNLALDGEPDFSDARRARLVSRFRDELVVLEARRDSLSFGPSVMAEGLEAPAANLAPRPRLAGG